MKDYKKPSIVRTDDMAEGIYAASGGADGSYSVSMRTNDKLNKKNRLCIWFTPSRVGNPVGRPVVVVTFNCPIGNIEFHNFNCDYTGLNTTTLKFYLTDDLIGKDECNVSVDAVNETQRPIVVSYSMTTE